MEKNDLLQGKNVVMVVTGSISAYRTPDIARDLKKCGATVKVVLSRSASEIIGKETLEWASEEPVLDRLTGNMEHISLFEHNKENAILLVCPATYNIIGKFAGGIADDPTSTIFANALGNEIKTVIVPAMHREMYESPILKSNIMKLQKLGVQFVAPRLEDGKAKLMYPEEIIDTLIRGKGNNKSLLIVSGRSEVPLDPVRSLVNKSSGYTGISLAREAYRNGYEKIIYIGNSDYRMPHYCEFIKCNLTDDFYRIAEDVVRNRKIDLIIIPAALSDFKLRQNDKKIKSTDIASLKLEPREKLLDRIAGIMKELKLNVPIIKFKLSDGNYVPENSDQVTVLNLIGEVPFGSKPNKYVIFDGNKKLMEKSMSKEELAMILIKIGDGLIEKH
ncbi:MAG: bifunctional phosphopantothenoylcysteine decarboxylase/phosphopantothenate--cysteine ligase CoaBC [Candidatus Thermoplasmatota archaeon]|nr:bifunctional phosphopantothenoylcysteine decarboxylase/phosphopantothenate--cysteine ligase CoaBC [Candidatus Thermoplasmatota archaeon]